MVDYRVRFVGDLGNLKQFDAAVQNSMGASAAALQRANLRIAQSAGVGPVDLLTKDSGAGRWATNLKTQIDSVNRTFIHSSDIVRRYVSGYTESLDDLGNIEVKPVFSDEYIANIKSVAGNYDSYLASLQQTQKTEARIFRLQEQERARHEAALNVIRQKELSLSNTAGGYKTALGSLTISNPMDKENLGRTYSEVIKEAEAKIKSIEAGALTRLPGLALFQGPGINQPSEQFKKLTSGYQFTSVLERELAARDLSLKTGRGGIGGQQVLNPAQLAEIKAEATALKDILAKIPLTINESKAETVAALKSYSEGLDRETAHIGREIQLLEQQIEKLKLTDAAGAQRAQTRINNLRASNPAFAGLDAATSANPPINANLLDAFRRSTQLRKQLEAGGLGAGARFDIGPNSAFAKNLAQQEAQFTKFTRNFRTGVATLEGSFRQLNTATGELGIVEKVTADIDKNGKVITRWGGQLSGTGSILRQTVRDFQKVIEWTIATTAVFGTLGLAISSLKTINDLNTSLTRFSITAQVSVGEARDIFKDLGQVAIDTATPLDALIKVADDIALATKTAGDSTEEWKAKIIDLTTAVGIFTNLTGEETVQGADKLASAFKQLSIAPRDLIGVLNQVTAVAGGQSTAINDIITALGGVGEAGKAAQLTIGEQIALVQVLGQVTNKSAADTATAFKNLFGAVSSPGSEKILAEFGIQIRDATGGLKPFLTIYREINKAVQDGTIPAQRYQDVLRGISGGPRRAPDAAALLGNLPAVEAAIARAGNASNEALIANAKILDTNQAKIQQLQNTFDITLFEKFGTAVQNATASVADFLTVLLNAFNSIDPKLISLLLTLGAITLAAKAISLLGGRVFGGLIGGAINFSKNLKIAITDTKAFIAEQTLAAALANGSLRYNAAGKLINAQGRFAKATDAAPISPTQGIIGGIGAKANAGIRGAFSPINTQLFGSGRGANILGGARGIAGIGLATAGLAAFSTALTTTNQDTKQTVGQILQLAGSVGLMTGAFTPLSIAALAAGTALQFFGNDAQEAKQSAHDSVVEVYDAVQKLKEARASADEARAAQSSARASLTSLTESGLKDTATKDAQTTATKAFVTATLDLANANQLVSKSYDDLLAKLPDLGEGYKQFKDLAKNGFIPQDQIDLLTEQLAQEILTAQNLGSLVNEPVTGPVHVAPATAPTAESIPGATLPLGTTPFDPRFLTPQGLKELFDLNNGGARTQTELPISQQNLSKLASSLNDIVTGKVKVDLNQDQIDILVKAVNDFIGKADTVVALQNKTTSDQAKVQAQGVLGSLQGDQLVNAQNRADLASALSAASRSADLGPIDKESRLGLPAGAKTTGVSLQQVQKLINDIASGEKGGLSINVDQLKAAGIALLAMKGSLGDIKSLGPEALNQGIAQELVNVGLNAEMVEKKFGLIPGTLQLTADELDAIDAKTKAFADAAASALDKFASRSANLLQQQNSGDFDKNSAGLKALQAQNQAAYESETQLIKSVKDLSGPAYTELQAQLSGVIGLQNAANISSDQLGGALIDQAIAAGVSAKGIKKIQDEVVKLINLSNVLSRIRTTYNIKVNVDAAGALKILKALLSAQLAFGASHHGPGGAYFQGQSIPGLQAAINELQAAIKAAGQAQSSINTVLAGGKGTSFGSLPKSSTGGTAASRAKAGYDISNLDLPAEIANASNRDALIKLAIANAKSLQSKIPGAGKDAKNDIVELLKGTQRILEVRGVKDDYLRKALEELADIEKKRLDFETKADTIRRIRVGSGSFAAIANVPVNSTSGVSLGSPNGPINVTLNLNGTVLTPAQLAQFADLVASALKRQIANG